MNKQEAIQEWKQLGIKHAEFEFSCGGDSMNDTTLNFYDQKNKVIQSGNLEGYFDSEIYRVVTFYEASDGHYQGEAGVVMIELDDESDDVNDHDFTYSKDSQAEYNEQFTEVIDIKLTAEQVNFIQLNVSNMNGGDSDSTTINYKRDFIMTDDDERIQNEIAELLDDEAQNCHFENASGEATDWYNFTTNGDDNDELEELTIVENHLKLLVNRTFVVYQDSNW